MKIIKNNYQEPAKNIYRSLSVIEKEEKIKNKWKIK